jgi:site-specific DNA-methyltransferase (adenine-specific)
MILRMANTLYYGDNLEVLRKYIKDESVDLCYIDPPFNSKRNYNQIYNNIGSEDRAQAQAFVDTWTWDTDAEEGFKQILSNDGNRFTAQTIDLIAGLQKVLKKGSLLAYLVSMTLRIVEIFRALKPTGSFYLHCDPTSSHYLKLVLDSVFIGGGGEFQNELIWCYSIGGKSVKRFARKHDVIFFYTKSNKDIHVFNAQAASIARKLNTHMRMSVDADGRQYQEKTDKKSGKVYRYYVDQGKIAEDYWTDIETLNREDAERLGYPTQKPEALLSRIIGSSSPENGVILDAYCGCGTTISVAQQLGRQWIGIDITYQSISLILRRLEGQFRDKWHEIEPTIKLNGIPRDMESAVALANKADDRVRKEFEKWAVLTYTSNRAIINDKKGADAGIDGVAYFQTGSEETGKMVFQVKSGGVGRGDIAKLNSDRQREGAELAVFITLQEPTEPMRREAKAVGTYQLQHYPQPFDRVGIVTAREILEGEGKGRLSLPTSLEVLKRAQLKAKGDQLDLLADN